MIYKFSLEHASYGSWTEIVFKDCPTTHDALRRACYLLAEDNDVTEVWVSENVATDGGYQWQYLKNISL